MGPKLVDLIAASIRNVHARFNTRQFKRQAVAGLENLELKERATHIAHTLRAQLPDDFPTASEILIASFGPPLTSTAGNGLATFFYLPHSAFIAHHGLDHFDHGMRANLELTQRFTAEFSIRPYIEKYPRQSLRLLNQWTRHTNPHVRRLVSEGTRPRLPWASRLTVFADSPEKTISLLEKLKDDPDLYVRRSVANHIADLLKDHPDIACEICEQWLREVSPRNISPEQRRTRHWIIRHAVRLPAKKGHPRAVKIRHAAK